MQTFYYCFFYNAAVVQLPFPQDLVFVFGDSRAKDALISISLTRFCSSLSVIDWCKYINFMSHLHFLDMMVCSIQIGYKRNQRQQCN